jgi:hypothetical protein
VLLDEEGQYSIEQSSLKVELDGFEISDTTNICSAECKDNYPLGVFFILAAMVGYSLMAFLAKAAYMNNPKVGAWDIVFVRSAF